MDLRTAFSGPSGGAPARRSSAVSCRRASALAAASSLAFSFTFAPPRFFARSEWLSARAQSAFTCHITPRMSFIFTSFRSQAAFAKAACDRKEVKMKDIRGVMWHVKADWARADNHSDRAKKRGGAKVKEKARELAAAKADARLQDTAELLLAGAPPEGPEKAVRRSMAPIVKASQLG